MAALRRRELLLPAVAALLLLLLPLAGRAAAYDAASPGRNDKLQALQPTDQLSLIWSNLKYTLLNTLHLSSNQINQVKLKNWVSGTQGTTVAGTTATFGATLPRTINEAQRTCAALTDPLDRCSNTTSKLTDYVALATWGQCALTAKAETSQAAHDEELYKMVCSVNDASINEPSQPVLDPSACFLFIMAVGTIVCASLWGQFVACEQINEQYNQLAREQQGSKSGTFDRQDKHIIEITAKRAGVLIVVASVFLFLRFYFMSSWMAWLLIVTFCFSGIEGMHVCLVTVISRIFKEWRNNTVQLPLYGEVLTLSVGMVPFCTVFAILWSAYRHSSFAWIGQDILGMIGSFLKNGPLCFMADRNIFPVWALG